MSSKLNKRLAYKIRNFNRNKEDYDRFINQNRFNFKINGTLIISLTKQLKNTRNFRTI